MAALTSYLTSPQVVHPANTRRSADVGFWSVRKIRPQDVARTSYQDVISQRLKDVVKRHHMDVVVRSDHDGLTRRPENVVQTSAMFDNLIYSVYNFRTNLILVKKAL